MALQALLHSQNYQTKAGMQNFGTLNPKPLNLEFVRAH
jgi:hypothetical protein